VVDRGLAVPPVQRAATAAVLGTAATNAILALIALTTGVLAARLLGPEGRGHLAAAQAVGGLLGAIGALALGEALVFFVGRRVRSPMVVLRTATVVATASTTALIGLAWMIMPALLRGQPAAIDPSRAYCLIGVPFVLVGFPITLMRALERYSAWNMLRLLPPLCWLAALIFFTVTRRMDVETLVFAFVGLQMLLVPLVWLLARRPEPGSAKLDFTLVSPMLRYGAPLFLATLPQALNVRFDQVLIANVESADQLGVYAVSVSWAGLGLPLMAAIGSVLFPRMAAMDLTDAKGTLGRSSRAGMIVAILIGVTSAISAPVLVPLLFGKSFAVPILLPIVLSAATSLLGLNLIIEEGLRGLGEPRSVLVGEVAGLTVTVALLLSLVSRLGIIGAAVASVAGYATVTAALAWRIKVRNDLSATDLLLPRRGDLSDILNRCRVLTARRGPTE
jgi:antigen flippase